MPLDLNNVGDLMIAIAPELVLTAWSLVVLMVVAWRHETPEATRLAGWLTFVGFVLSGATVVWLWARGASAPPGSPMMAVDGFRFVVDLIFLAAGALTVLLSLDYLTRDALGIPEYYVLLQFAVLGMMFMGGGSDLIVLFLGIELLSVCVYVLTAFNRKSAASAEAGFKYFLLGAFASGFLLYGIALVFGATGAMNLGEIARQIVALGLGNDLMLLIGVTLLLIGLAFKVAAVPFHMWAPDVYDGAPTPLTAFMATGVKAAAVAALVRVVLEGFGPLVTGWPEIVWGLAVATMIGGNLIALAQRTLKRMLAYSSIAHAGYIFVALVARSDIGTSAILFYLAAYTVMTIAAFTVLMGKGTGDDRHVRIDDLSGLRQTHPWMAFAMAVAMLSLLGFPGTAGFIGKWYILQSAIESGNALLAVILVLTSVVSAGYYLPVIMAMYMKAAPEPEAHARVGLAGPARFVLGLTTAVTLIIGVWPSPALDLARTTRVSAAQAVQLDATDGPERSALR